MTELAFRSAVDLARMIRAREIGALELAEHYIARIERDPREGAPRSPETRADERG